MRTGKRGKDLVWESEVFLSGHYAEYLDVRHLDVPDWAWLSVLTHSSSAQLRSLASEDALCGRTRARTTNWWQAIAFLAGEIVTQCGDRNVDDLRRSVLVPLELAWLTSDRSLQRPGRLVRTVLDAFDRYHKAGVDGIEGADGRGG
jgi:hypothetical protein